MSIAGLSARHGRAVLLGTVLLALAGLVSLRSLPSDIYPPLQFPRVIVVAHVGTIPGRSMMVQVTRPIEEAIMEVPGIRRVRSTTFRGATEISAQFEPRTDIVLALQQVQNQVAELRSELPADIELTVERLTPAEFPMLSYNLTGGLSEADLHDYAFFVVRPALARVPGVGRVAVQASDQREYEVVVDPARLLATGLTMPNVADALKASNQLSPVGRYPLAGKQYLVLASGMWTSPQDILQAPVLARGGATVRVSDLGTVFPGAPDRTALVTGNGRPAAVVNVSQQLGARILDVRDGVEARLQELTRNLPSGLVLSKVYDLAGFVEDAIGSVRDAILIGGLLAVVVLYLFLRDWRVTAIAALTLPLTVVSTFFFMRLFGETVNVMSMGGLAVAIGLVIDDAVVVVENIHRHLALKEGPGAVERATSELVAPVVGSTLTTVVVFAPLGLLSGVVGQFFRALSITLSVAVLISLVLALTLIPLLTRWSWRDEGHDADATRGAGLADRYGRALDRAVSHPRWVAAAMAVLVLAAVVLYRFVPTGFLPHMDEGGFVIDYRTPPGTAIEETDKKIRKLEKMLAGTPEVAAFRGNGSEMGTSRPRPRATSWCGSSAVASGTGRATRSSALRDRIGEEVPGVEVEFVQLLQDMLGDLEGSAAPLEVKIFGDDPSVLQDLSEQLQERLGRVQGLVDLVGMEVGGPEQTWQVDPAAAGRLGLTVEAVADQVQAALLGEVATEIRLSDRTVPVRVRYPDDVRFDPGRVATTTVRGADAGWHRLGALARRPSHPASRC
jgi:multidrug efflux pump subunit AcrB